MIVGLSNVSKVINSVFLNHSLNEVVSLSYSQIDKYDVQCNNLIKFSKHEHINEIIEEISNLLEKENSIESFEITNTNFINLRLSKDYLYKYSAFNKDCLPSLNQSILIDYGGPNIGKALHVGHLRTLNIGRAIYNLNKFAGNEVVSDIHFGDWGMPVSQILAYINENNLDLHTLQASDLEQIYPEANKMSSTDESFYEKAKNISNELNVGNKEYKKQWESLYNLSVEEIKNLLTKLGHNFDYFYGESDVINESKIVLKEASENSLTRKDEGALVSTEEADPPIILVKSDGSYLYLTTDLGTVYFREKNFNVDKYLYVVDQRQSNHFAQVFSTVKHFKLSDKDFFHIAYGTVNGKDGKPLKTRDGGTYKLEKLYQDTYKQLEKNNDDPNIVDCLTNSVLTYSDLLPNRKINYQFDLEKFTDINGKTAIYLQYAQVRAKKLLDEGKGLEGIESFEVLDVYERDLAVKLTKFTYFVNISLEKYEPHHLAEYAYDLAKSFNTFYTNCKIFSTEVSQDDLLKRLHLVRTFHKTIKDVFFCLGITPVEQM